MFPQWRLARIGSELDLALALDPRLDLVFFLGAVQMIIILLHIPLPSVFFPVRTEKE